MPYLNLYYTSLVLANLVIMNRNYVILLLRFYTISAELVFNIHVI